MPIETEIRLHGMKLVLTQDPLEFLDNEVALRTTFRHPETGEILPFPNPNFAAMNIEKLDTPPLCIGARDYLLECTDGSIYISKEIAMRMLTVKNAIDETAASSVEVQCDVDSVAQAAHFYNNKYRLPDNECPADGIKRPIIQAPYKEPENNTDPLKRIYLTEDIIKIINIENEKEFYYKVIAEAQANGEKFATYRYSETFRYGDAAEYLEADDFLKFNQWLVNQFCELVAEYKGSHFDLAIEELRVATNKQNTYTGAQYKELKAKFVD